MYIIVSESAIFYYKFLLFATGLLINILILFYYQKETDDFNNDWGNANTLVTIISFVNSIGSGLVLLFWFIFTYPVIIYNTK